MKKILVIGATSAIAEATARLWAGQGHRLYLLGRDERRLHAIAADLQVRGAESAHHAVLDVNDFAQHVPVLDAAIGALGGIDIVLVAHGTLADQRETNAISVISLLTHLANHFEAQGHGSIAAISSVAGDRGRQSNYVYGTAKSAVSTFTQGLRNRLHRSGVQVLTIKPGFVDTPMTAQFEKNWLWATPESVARSIDKAIATRRDVLYTPWFWLGIMGLIRLIPERVFKTLKI
jgi:decaprenylphospho-beta-D-erythro-pentofuranosid-2-ulose 2-reductase